MLKPLIPVCYCIPLIVSVALESMQQPPLDQMPLSITSYWLFDENGRPTAWGGQANGDPYHYANGEETSADHAGRVGACIQDWTLYNWTKAIRFTWQGRPMLLHCYDNFGAVSYRRPFYHDGYETWVIPVDILSPEPYHGLVYDWALEVVPVGSLEE